jgi:hypothetical protein
MMLAVGVQGLSAAALAHVAAAVAVIGAISVYGLLHVDRRWASYAALLFEVVLVVLFAYTVNIIYALYSAPGFGSFEDINSAWSISGWPRGCCRPCCSWRRWSR